MRKREVRKMSRQYRKMEKEQYLEEKQKYEEWYREKRERHEEKEEVKLRSIKTEEGASKYINRYRKKRKNIDEEITMEEWKYHFMYLLDGKEDRRILDFREGEEEEEQQDILQEKIPGEEIIKKFRQLKKSKAPRVDEIENEAQRLMPVEIGEQFVKLINKVWRGKGLPEKWRMRVIQPI